MKWLTIFLVFTASILHSQNDAILTEFKDSLPNYIVISAKSLAKGTTPPIVHGSQKSHTLKSLKNWFKEKDIQSSTSLLNIMYDLGYDYRDIIKPCEQSANCLSFPTYIFKKRGIE